MTLTNSFIIISPESKHYFCSLLSWNFFMMPALLNRLRTVSDGLRADLQPLQGFLFVDLHCSRISQRVISTDLLDKSTVARRTGIRYDQAIERSL